MNTEHFCIVQNADDTSKSGVSLHCENLTDCLRKDQS